MGKKGAIEELREVLKNARVGESSVPRKELQIRREFEKQILKSGEHGIRDDAIDQIVDDLMNFPFTLRDVTGFAHLTEAPSLLEKKARKLGKEDLLKVRDFVQQADVFSDELKMMFEFELTMMERCGKLPGKIRERENSLIPPVLKFVEETRAFKLGISRRYFIERLEQYVALSPDESIEEALSRFDRGLVDRIVSKSGASVYGRYNGVYVHVTGLAELTKALREIIEFMERGNFADEGYTRISRFLRKLFGIRYARYSIDIEFSITWLKRHAQHNDRKTRDLRAQLPFCEWPRLIETPRSVKR